MTTSPDAIAVDDDACFACGSRNADGLGLRFVHQGREGARAYFTLDPKYQGYRGIAHGGIVMLLLDEAMAHAAGAGGDQVMTAAVAVRFRAPVRLGAVLQIVGRVLSKRGKILKVEGAVLDAAGTTLATADGSFVRIGSIEPGRFGNPAAAEAV